MIHDESDYTPDAEHAPNTRRAAADLSADGASSSGARSSLDVHVTAAVERGDSPATSSLEVADLLDVEAADRPSERLPRSPQRSPSNRSSSPSRSQPILPLDDVRPPTSPRLPSNTPPATDHPPPMIPDHLLPLLMCPVCHPPAPLAQPVTLHCGHSICSQHFVRDPSPSTAPGLLSFLAASPPPQPAQHDPHRAPTVPPCPLPSCAPATAPASTHPSSFHVDYPPEPASPPAAAFPSQRADVTLTKLQSVVLRSRDWFQAPPDLVRAHPADAEEQTDSEDGDGPDSPIGEYGPDDRDPASGSRRAGVVLGRRRRRRRGHSPHGSPPPPRRRRRLTRPDPPAQDASARLEKELLAELTCEICFSLLWQPVTTPCQHTFCSKCLHRSLDHSSTCPLCRQELPGYAYFQEHPCNKTVLAILLKAFPGAYAERGATIEAEERDSRLDTPIFVCQLSFPGMPTVLHLFEPRYRLMLRRCLASPRPCFGMIPPPRSAPSSSAGTGSGNDYGTMLEIRNVRMLPDGRSVVETWGTTRFRLMERGSLDGYMVGRIETIEDEEDIGFTATERIEQETAQTEESSATTGAGPSNVPAAGAGSSNLHAESNSSSAEIHRDDRLLRRRIPGAPPVSELTGNLPLAAPSVPHIPSNAELMAKCHEFIDQMREGTPWVVQQHIDAVYVPMPTDHAQFSYWMALLLPIDEHEKAKLLPIRSARLRLRLVVHWIEQLQSNWARSYASASRWQVVLWWVHRMLMRVFLGRPLVLRAYVFASFILAVFITQMLLFQY